MFASINIFKYYSNAKYCKFLFIVVSVILDIHCISSVIRWRVFFPFQNKPKNLGLSNKIDLNVLDCFGRELGHIVQWAGHLTRKSEVLGSIPGLATFFCFSLC